MSLDLDPLEPEPEETQPAMPSMPPSALEAESRSRMSRFAWAYDVPIGVWIGLGVVATLIAVILIIGIASLVRAGSQTATPTPEPPRLTPTPIGPWIDLAPTAVSPGQVVTVRGASFASNDPITVFLRDPLRPSDPILQVAKSVAANDGSLVVSFVYPLDPRYAALAQVDVIAQSGLTGGYVTAPLGVSFNPVPATPSAPTPGGGIGTRLPMNTLTPIPTFAPPTLIPTLAPPTFAPPTLAVSTWTPVPPTWTLVPPTAVPPSPTPNITDWRGEYFNNSSLSGAPVVVRNDRDVNFNWGRGSPDPAVPVDNFSVRWTRTLNFEGRLYRFSAQADDGVRVYVDNQLIIDEWHPAAPPVYTRDVSVSAGPHQVRVEFYEGVLDAYIYFKIEAVNQFNGWKGEYFNNPFLGGSPLLIRDDTAVGFDWGGNSPATGLPAQKWSARWTKSVEFPAGVYRFSFRVDDGVRFMVDGALVINEFHSATGQVYQKDVNLAAGVHTLVVEYYQDTLGSYIWLTYQPTTTIENWRAEYYANDRWGGYPTVIRNEQRLDFDWGTGSPDGLIPVDHFSARFTRSIDLTAGEYQFDVLVDDGVRFYVDGLPVLDKILEQAATRYSLRLTLTQGRHDFRIDYVEYTGEARLAWSRTPLSITPTPTRPASPTPTQPPSLPVIDAFDVVPNQTQVGGCVNLTWRTSGNTIFARILRNGGLFKDNVALAGTASDCLNATGTFVYRLEAFNSLNQTATADRTVSVTGAPATATASAPPTINSFTASADMIAMGQCVTLNWSTSNATSAIALEVNGQGLGTNLPASGSASDCPTTTGQLIYSLIITTSPNYGPISQSVIVTVGPQPR